MYARCFCTREHRELMEWSAAEKEALTDCPNVLAYQRVLETERAGYLMREWVASNLYDRIRYVLDRGIYGSSNWS